MKLRNLASALCGLALFTFGAMAQTAQIEGDVKGPDGKPMIGAMVKIDRTDIKAHYQVKTNKKGHYFYAGLAYGTYTVSVEVDGKDQVAAQGVPLRGGADPTNVPIDLSQA